MSYKVEQEFNKLLAMGIPEKMAKICACAKYGQEQEARDEMAYLIEEQETIKEQLANFVPFHENKPIVEEDCEDEKPVKKIKIPNNIDDQQDKKPDLQHQL